MKMQAKLILFAVFAPQAALLSVSPMDRFRRVLR